MRIGLKRGVRRDFVGDDDDDDDDDVRRRGLD